MDKKPQLQVSQKFMLTVLTVLCIVLIGVSFFTDKLTAPVQNALSYIITPLQKGINGMGLWLTDRADYFATIDELRQENEQLKTELDEVKEKNLVLIQDQIELNNLRELYALDNKIPGYEKVAARVIGKSSGNWFSTFTIDKGSKDGILVDMNVICGNGLVGIVTDVTDNSATVRSIIDDNSNVTGMLITSSDTCNIRGDLELIDSGYVHLEYLRGDVNVSDGDMIVTSNISSKYIEGILIGYAKNVSDDANSLTQSGYLVPAVDFEHMTEVLVIMQLKQ
ncbi:cell shape-determining protein MreC [Firmicutes bacterium CAG:882]|jgi:rod shape-determining protein MreC|nr:cell shape-determining protein MreC [Firmicutes bacterium CAG:882]